MKEEFKKLFEKIKELGWKVNIESDVLVSLGKYSPAGQDFYIDIDIDMEGDINDFIQNIYDSYDNFDVSYETYLWLGSDGHGVNGAPYDMIDVYHDMETCKNNIFKLYQELIK